MKKQIGERRVRAELKLAGITDTEDLILHELALLYKDTYKEGLIDYGYTSVDVQAEDDEITATVDL